MLTVTNKIIIGYNEAGSQIRKQQSLIITELGFMSLAPFILFGGIDEQK